jgi:hypothetical protein
MERQKNTFGVISLVGGILIILNILLIAMNSGPIVLSSSYATIDDLLPATAPIWLRIAFGIRDYTDATALAIGAMLAAIIVYLGLSLYLSPRNAKPLSLLIMLLSAVALLYGGGFIIGSILAFVGAALMYETPRKFSQTLMGKILSSMRASSQIFQHFLQDSSVKDAAMVILFANLLSGIGNGIFTFNVAQIIGATNAATPFEILFTGRISLDASIVQTPIILMGLGIFKWALLSLIFFFVGANLFGQKASLPSVAACTGFAYAPIALQLFTPFIFTSSPYLTQWSFAMYLVTNLWMILILIVGMKQIMNVSLTKSAATVASCGALYTLINYLIFTQVSIPYVIKFQIQPPETMLALMSIMIVVPLLFMGKKSS